MHKLWDSVCVCIIACAVVGRSFASEVQWRVQGCSSSQGPIPEKGPETEKNWEEPPPIR